jgi:hypothetical protein
MKRETIAIKAAPQSGEVLKVVDGIDDNHVMYGNFIGLQYVFNDTLDPDCLAGAISDLAAHFPAITGYYDRKTGTIRSGLKELSLQLTGGAAGRAQDFSEFGTAQGRRHDFIDEPSRQDVLGGTANLATFKLTTFAGGGCILGMAISHVLTDAAGFHNLAQRLAVFYSGRVAKSQESQTPVLHDLEVFKFGTQRSKPDTLQALTKAGFKKPAKLKGPVGVIISRLIIRALDKMTGNSRVVIYLGSDHMARLKQTVLTESGEDWISTNVALCAHFTSIIGKLMYGVMPKTNLAIGELLDLRGRYFKDAEAQQTDYVGNAIHIYIEQAQFEKGMQFTGRGDLAKFFKQSITGLNEDFLKRRLDLVADSLAHGFTYPGLDMKDPLLALNNQSKMAVYDLKFSGSDLLRVIPQDVGDNIMFFPVPGGGVEVYIRDILNPARQQKLLTDKWQAMIYDV